MAVKDNFANPQGIIGRIMLSCMNIGHSPMAKWGFTQLEIPNEGNLLDIGCGGGYNIRRLIKLSKNGFVYGVDTSLTSVNKSKKINKKYIGNRCEILQGSADNLPLEANSIRLAIAFETVYFWEDLNKYFQDVYRVLEPKGEFVIVNDPGNPDKHWENMIPRMKAYKAEEIEDVMKVVGFKDLRVTKNKFMFCVYGKKE